MVKNSDFVTYRILSLLYQFQMSYSVTGIIEFCYHLILWHVTLHDCFIDSQCPILEVQHNLVGWYIGFCDCLQLCPGLLQNQIMPLISSESLKSWYFTLYHALTKALRQYWAQRLYLCYCINIHIYQKQNYSNFTTFLVSYKYLADMMLVAT